MVESAKILITMFRPGKPQSDDVRAPMSRASRTWLPYNQKQLFSEGVGALSYQSIALTRYYKCICGNSLKVLEQSPAVPPMSTSSSPSLR